MGERVAAMLETGEGYRAAAAAAVRALELQLKEPRVGPHTRAGVWRELRLARARHTHTAAVNDHDDQQDSEIGDQRFQSDTWMCAERAGLPPLLVVQAGPGLPLRHELKGSSGSCNWNETFS
jgi:hypothetical protein